MFLELEAEKKNWTRGEMNWDFPKSLLIWSGDMTLWEKYFLSIESLGWILKI